MTAMIYGLKYISVRLFLTYTRINEKQHNIIYTCVDLYKISVSPFYNNLKHL